MSTDTASSRHALRHHAEPHKLDSVAWLRAAVLGANDGIISTSSLVIGVATAHASHGSIVLTGVAGLVAGAMSMATGEYVSVSSQADTENAALAQERAELDADFAHERRELAAIYVKRGLDIELAKQVAEALMVHDALGAHARDELGISELNASRPLLAAGASAASFSSGAVLPLLVAALMPAVWVAPVTAAAALGCLAALGGLAAKVGGASVKNGMGRVLLWSALSMAVSSCVGMAFRSVG